MCEFHAIFRLFRDATTRIALLLLAGLVAFPVFAEMPDIPIITDIPIVTLEGSPETGLSVVQTQPSPKVDFRTALSNEISRMNQDLADISRFSRLQENLERMIQTKPEDALRRRLPMAECLDSLFEPICHKLTGLFKPEDAEK